MRDRRDLVPRPREVLSRARAARTPPPPPPPPERARPRSALLPDVVLPLLIAGAVLLAFSPALGAGFVSWDDDANFVANEAFRGLGADELRWMWSTFHLGHYVPVTWMTLGLDYLVWGMDPRGYHLTNVLLHAAAAIVLYSLARRLLALRAGSAGPGVAGAAADASVAGVAARDRALAWAAAAGALLFALHPLRVESVAWVTERRDVLSGLLALVSAWCYLRYAEEGPARRAWYRGALAAFALAVLSKATVVTLPALLLVLEIHPLRRIGGAAGWWTPATRRILLGLAPFGLTSLAIAALSFVALDPVPQLPPAGKVAVSLYSLAFYAWKTVVPTGLAPLYSMPARVDPLEARFVVSAVAVLAITGAAVAAGRRWRGVPWAWAAFVLALLPMLGVHQNGHQIAADRYTYHAAPVLAIALAFALATIFARADAPTAAGRTGGGTGSPARGTTHAIRAATATLVAAALASLAVLTWRQAHIWRDSEALWERVVAVDRAGSIGPNNLGNLRMAAGRLAEAERLYATATERDPGYAEAWNNLGVARARQGRGAEAVAPLERALALRPAYDEAAVNLGLALAQAGEPERAAAAFARALRLNARNAMAHLNWGNLLVRTGRPHEAIARYEAALAIEPGNAVAMANLEVARQMAAQVSARP